MVKTVADVMKEGQAEIKTGSQFDQLDEQLRDHLVETIYMAFEHRWCSLAVAYLRRWDQRELEQLLEHLAGLD